MEPTFSNRLSVRLGHSAVSSHRLPWKFSSSYTITCKEQRPEGPALAGLPAAQFQPACSSRLYLQEPERSLVLGRPALPAGGHRKELRLWELSTKLRLVEGIFSQRNIQGQRTGTPSCFWTRGNEDPVLCFSVFPLLRYFLLCKTRCAMKGTP